MTKTIYITILLSGLLLIPIFSLAANSITWYQPDFPPFVILKGAEKQQGIDNSIVEFVIKRMPEYTHTYKPTNYKRILQYLADKQHGIVTPLFKSPEREKFVHYSNIPSYLVFSNGFIYPKKDRDKYTPYILDDGTLDLEALCRSHTFNIAINTGRSYYGLLDEIIKRHREEGVFYARSTIDHYGIFEMVVHKRVDAALGFPVEIKFAGFEQELDFLHVSKMPTMTPVFFGAAKNEFGIETINILNTILADDDIINKFGEFYKYWLSEDKKTEYDIIRSRYYSNLKN